MFRSSSFNQPMHEHDYHEKASKLTSGNQAKLRTGFAKVIDDLGKM